MAEAVNPFCPVPGDKVSDQPVTNILHPALNNQMFFFSGADKPNQSQSQDYDWNTNAVLNVELDMRLQSPKQTQLKK